MIESVGAKHGRVAPANAITKRYLWYARKTDTRLKRQRDNSWTTLEEVNSKSLKRYNLRQSDIIEIRSGEIGEGLYVFEVDYNEVWASRRSNSPYQQKFVSWLAKHIAKNEISADASLPYQPLQDVVRFREWLNAFTVYLFFLAIILVIIEASQLVPLSADDYTLLRQPARVFFGLVGQFERIFPTWIAYASAVASVYTIIIWLLTKSPFRPIILSNSYGFKRHLGYIALYLTMIWSILWLVESNSYCYEQRVWNLACDAFDAAKPRFFLRNVDDLGIKLWAGFGALISGHGLIMALALFGRIPGLNRLAPPSYRKISALDPVNIVALNVGSKTNESDIFPRTQDLFPGGNKSDLLRLVIDAYLRYFAFSFLTFDEMSQETKRYTARVRALLGYATTAAIGINMWVALGIFVSEIRQSTFMSGNEAILIVLGTWLVVGSFWLAAFYASLSRFEFARMRFLQHMSSTVSMLRPLEASYEMSLGNGRLGRGLNAFSDIDATLEVRMEETRQSIQIKQFWCAATIGLVGFLITAFLTLFGSSLGQSFLEALSQLSAGPAN